MGDLGFEIKPYDIRPTLLMLVHDASEREALKAQWREQDEAWNALTPEERIAFNLRRQRYYRRKEYHEYALDERLEARILSVLSRREWEWFMARRHDY